MIKYAFRAKRDRQLWPICFDKHVSICVAVVFLGILSFTSPANADDSIGLWVQDQWKQQRLEISCFLKHLVVPKHGISVIDSETPTIGFPRYALGGCQLCHGPQCRVPVTPKAPDLSVPVRIDHQKRIQLANICMHNAIMPIVYWAMMFRESTAERGRLSVLERPPRFS